jgi:universal stress protein E
MSFRTRRILVAIRDERRAPRSALRKAAMLARASGARVELYHAINAPQAVDSLRRGFIHGDAARDVIDREVQLAEKRLARLAALKDFKGLKVTCRATWDYPSHEAIIREAMASGADLIVASVQPQSAGGRLLLANNDWELIRHSPCPVLLVKATRLWRKPAVVAAVDPFHAHDKPASLDRRILEAAQYVARHTGGTLHAFHAFMPLTVIAPAPAGQALYLALPPGTEEIHTEQVKRTFERSIAKFPIPPARRHLEMGLPQDELVRVAREIGARIAVTGAVSRSAWKRFIIGHTAEKLLDRLDCDLLIVKPRDFRTRVPRRATLAWLEG